MVIIISCEYKQTMIFKSTICKLFMNKLWTCSIQYYILLVHAKTAPNERFREIKPIKKKGEKGRRIIHYAEWFWVPFALSQSGMILFQTETVALYVLTC